VGLGSDGAAVMFGAQNGALVRLRRFAPHALLLWDPAHRTGLSGRDLEQHKDVKQIKDLFALIAADQNHSAKRTQQRLLEAAAASVEACAVQGAKDIRWLSLQTSCLSVLKQYAVVAAYYMNRGVSDSDSQAEGIWSYLSDARIMLFVHSLMAVLSPVNAACKRFQEAAGGLPDVQHTIDEAKETLQRTCIAGAEQQSADAPGSSCGKHFADLVCNDRKGVNSNFALRFWDADEDGIAKQLEGVEIDPLTKVAVMEYGPEGSKEAVVLWDVPEGRRRRREPLLESRWDETVAAARITCQQVAERMLQSLSERFPDETQRVFALAAFMSPHYWGLRAEDSQKDRAAAVKAVDLAALKDSLVELAGMFDAEVTANLSEVESYTVAPKVTGAVAKRDLDGSDGSGERLLTSQVEEEVHALVEFVKTWPVIGGRTQVNVKWGEFWGGLLEDDEFALSCPFIRVLVQIVTVIPSGSVENERGFSAMNRLAEKVRNSLKSAHMNVVVRLHGQKDKMLADYSPQIVEFLRRMLKPST